MTNLELVENAINEEIQAEILLLFESSASKIFVICVILVFAVYITSFINKIMK